MAATGDLIDFEVIETQKENIQSLPSGRSAKSLASVFSPVAIMSPSNTQDINDVARAKFETELVNIDDSDDPLEVYDRYVKWTLNAYPTTQATPQSQLLPLLERATKFFLSSTHYKNDPRYLRLWLHYIRLFCDAPRETFAYLSRHGIGESLALFYEEFAAWLESAGRWIQAEEVYKMGIEKEARPIERLVRKFGGFEKRFQARPVDIAEPSSPALPTVRPALAAKVDPFAATDSSTPVDPQAASRSRAPAASTKKQKLAIFSDDGEAARPMAGDVSRGWENVGTMAERKKENKVGARPWNGEAMKSETSKAGVPAKMMIFKDQSNTRVSKSHVVPEHPSREQKVINPRSGKMECVFVNLEAIYPDPHNPNVEYCFEELRAAQRGWLQRDWRKNSTPSEQTTPRSPLTEVALEAHNNSPDHVQDSSQKLQTLPLNDLYNQNDENRPPLEKSPSQKMSLARKMRREEKANRTRKIKVREVRGETQTIQTNLDSPQGPRLRRKKSSEPTMTLHTKAAQDEMYDIFSAPLKSEEVSEEPESDMSSSEDDEYTSGGESTGTGRISGTTSEIGEETRNNLNEGKDQPEVDNTENDTGWTEFDARRDVPGRDLIEPETDDPETEHTSDVQSQEPRRGLIFEEEVVTPTSPTPFLENRQTRYIPIPPEDFEPPTRPYRDPDQVAQSRLPFMTPIVEKTESSLGTATGRHEKDYFSAKTPCPKGEHRSLVIHEDDQEQGSSPSQELLEEVKTLEKAMLPPKLKKASQSSVVAMRSRVSPKQRSAAKTTALRQGPVIEDKQCNPMDPQVHDAILQEMSPPLSAYEGYFEHLNTNYDRRGEIRKYCRSVAKSKGSRGDSNNERTSHTMQLPPILPFEGAHQRLNIIRELGAGAFAPVYLAESMDDTSVSDQEDAHSPQLYALKAEDPPTAWEFHILRLAHTRLATSHAQILSSLVVAHSLHLHRDEGYLLLSYSPHGTLLELVNACARDTPASSGGCAGGSGTAGMDDVLAMWCTVELLRAVEALHAVGIVHGDIKADNVLVRFDRLSSSSSNSSNEVTTPYTRTGAHGWSARGITLIDFGRGIDMRAFRGDVQFIADWAVGATDCAEMQEARPWTFQGDNWGIAAVAFTMLWGRYIDTVAVAADGLNNDGNEDDVIGMGMGGRGKNYVLRESLKRYWQTELWAPFFALLLNSGSKAVLEAEEGQKLPALRGMSKVKGAMEDWLETSGETRAGGRCGLRGLVRRAEGLVAGKGGRK